MVTYPLHSISLEEAMPATASKINTTHTPASIRSSVAGVTGRSEAGSVA